jgi:D-proline reductase (dithiol) PrdB
MGRGQSVKASAVPVLLPRQHACDLPDETCYSLPDYAMMSLSLKGARPQVSLPVIAGSASRASETVYNIAVVKEGSMPRLETLSAVNRQVLLSFPCLEPDTTPWTPLRKPLSQAKLALVTSAGLHIRGDKPFIGDPKGGDPSYRMIPSTASAADILQSHVSIGFDHTAIYRDMNVTLPLDRAKELVEKGIVGSLAPNYYSFMGAVRDPRRLLEKTGPEVAKRLTDEGVDLVFITPT